jgi:DNA-directed RNA polymerase specialized sigma24 family protein
MTPHDSITHWIEQIRSSDTTARDEAAERIWSRYSARLLDLARNHLDRRIRQREDEDDVVQNVYASFCRRMQRGEYQLDNRQDLWNLLVTMTLHKTRKAALRHNRQGRAVSREEGGLAADGSDSLATPAERMPAPDPTPEEAAELAEGVERLLRALPDPTLRQVALWKLEGYTSEEIAGTEKLDCALRTVERKLRVIRAIWEEMDT